MDVWVLGPLEVRLAGRVVPVGSAQQGAVLALLALAGGGPVSRDAIVDALWGADPPRAATNVVQTYVARLRRLLGADAIATVPGGYRLVGADVDAVRFERAVLSGGADRHELRAALDLWRGPVLPECSDAPGVVQQRARLEELRWTATEQWAEAELAVGRGPLLVPRLAELVRAEPLRESLRAALVTALYQSGRQAEALQVCAEGRVVLREELGVDPGRALQRVEQAVLRHDPALDAQRAVHPTDVPANAGALRALVLPRPLTSFVGRAGESGDVERLLASTRLLTLTGSGGTGKTRLALHVASRVAPGYDEVRFVDLQAVHSEGSAAAAVAVAVGLTQWGRDPVSAVSAYLGRLRALLLFDNCEHVVQEVAEVVHHLLAAVPGLRVLATSREPLRVPGEVVWVVPPMRVEPGATNAGGGDSDAVLLLTARAEEARPGSTTRPTQLPSPRSVDGSTVFRWRSNWPPLACAPSRSRS